jgi:hypothetical protein
VESAGKLEEFRGGTAAPTSLNPCRKSHSLCIQIHEDLFIKWLPHLLRDHQNGNLPHSTLLRRFYAYGRVLPNHIVELLSEIPAVREYASDMHTWSRVNGDAREKCRERCQQMTFLTSKRLEYQKLLRNSMSDGSKATEADRAAQRHIDAIFS